MIEQLAIYAQIIIAIGIIMVVWQLEKAGRLLKMMSQFLAEAVEEHNNENS